MNIKVNENFDNISESYLFSEINKRVKAYKESHPEADIVRLGIGDVTLPLAQCVIDASKKAVEEMGIKETFRGYPPEYGYEFMKDAVRKYYQSNGVELKNDDIFISDGAKSDLGNIVDILGNNDVYIPNPVYPVYLDSNIMSGNKIHLFDGNEKNGFLPLPEELEGVSGGVIYLCSPNNPTGAAYDRNGLKKWVDFALSTGSLLIYDSAYEAFIEDENQPHSIYEIDGSKECAIEICSFSKQAGFTGMRCGWTVVPTEIAAGSHSLNKMWKRRQATKFNGVSYPVQRAAEAALSEEGIAQCMKNIEYYKENARLLADLMKRKNIFFTGGISSPYIWLKCPNNMRSWEFFDMLLEKGNIVGTPGAGFGTCGEGFFRLTAFGTREATIEAIRRLENIL